jgi:hypothetical protein
MLTYVDTVALDTPVSHWRLGEATGATVAADARAYGTNLGNQGAYTGTITLGAIGLLRQDDDTAVSFDGSTAYVTVTDASNLRPGTADWSMEFWLSKASPPGATLWVLAKGDATTTGYEARLTTSGYVQARIGAVTVTGTINVCDGVTHHVIVSMDRDGNGVVYVDGRQDVATSIAAESSRDLNGTAALELGRSGSTYYDATLDEVAYYSEALSATQARDHYVAGWRTAVRMTGFLQAVQTKAANLVGFLMPTKRTDLVGYLGYAGGDYRGALTTTQRNALGYKRQGDVIWNVDTTYQEWYNAAAGTWESSDTFQAAAGARTNNPFTIAGGQFFLLPESPGSTMTDGASLFTANTVTTLTSVQHFGSLETVSLNLYPESGNGRAVLNGGTGTSSFSFDVSSTIAAFFDDAANSRGYLRFKSRGTTNAPSTPSTGFANVYVRRPSSKSILYWMSDDGTEYDLADAAYYSVAGTFTTLQTFERGASSNDAVRAQVTSDSNPRFIVEAGGTVKWGSGSAGTDTNLYRAGGSILQTDDQFYAAGGLTTSTKAGAPSDADTALDQDGSMILDTSNHRLYVRSGGAWKYATLT